MKFNSILIVSSCSEPWGGSEELWNNLAYLLKSKKHNVSLYKDIIDHRHVKIQALKDNDVAIFSILNSLNFIYKLIYKILIKLRVPFVERYKIHFLVNKIFRTKGLINLLKKHQFDKVIISQGINYDGLDYAWACNQLGVEYYTISQKVIETSFIQGEEAIKKAKTSLLEAKHNFFVSKHNQTITEEQIASKIENATVVYNPNKFQNLKDFPETNYHTETFTFLCIGRYYLSEKGQDILLRILAEEKWKQRPLKVKLIGSGIDQQILQNRIDYYQLKNVEISKFKLDLEKEWKNAHGLILSSRHEGMPLVMLEAMSLGKVCIMGDAGGANEVIEDSYNGFIGAPTTIDFDKTLERAWQMKSKWAVIAQNAKSTMLDIERKEYPSEEKLLNILLN
ncbi:Glycos_transf_1 domain-containing protein [Tenacibaculum sp. 190130A14a]|uniref:Glycos_transf_1 domain-containing protein n=1 Tax=Tenacibaculum polynesiense TaxID=3137857 RepID=A0ABM9PB72_9FLAO